MVTNKLKNAPIGYIFSQAKDTYDMCKGKMSGETYCKKSMANSAGHIGGVAGAHAGALIGTSICPGAGTVVGGFIGSIVGSSACKKSAEKALRKV